MSNTASESTGTILGKKMATMCITIVFCTSMVFPSSIAFAGNKEESNQAIDAGLGVASVLITIPYGVAKIIYAGLGGMIGGITWAFTGGNTEIAEAVWEPSFYGTYVITPDHLKGNKPVRFMGVSPHKHLDKRR